MRARSSSPIVRPVLACCFFAALSLGVTSCGFNSALGDVVLLCQSSADCPPGTTCRLSVGACVGQGNPLRDVELAPAVGRAGTHFTLRLLPNVPLVAPPAVRALATGQSGPVAAVFTGEGEDAEGAYLYGWTPTGDEPEGTWEVLADAQSVSGQHYPGSAVGALRLDFTAPSALSAAVTLEPADDNGLVQAGFSDLLAAATAGTRVTARVSADEALAPGATLTAFALADDTATVPLARDDAHSSETLVVAGAALPGGPLPQGAWGVRVDWADALGNRRRFDATPRFTVDTAPPSPPDVVTPARLVYRRAPSGSLDSPDAGAWTLRGAPGAVAEPGVLAAFLDGLPAGNWRVDGDGGVGTVALASRVDHEEAKVMAIDLAGNRSALVPVRDVEWVSFATADAGLQGFRALAESRYPAQADRRATARGGLAATTHGYPLATYYPATGVVQATNHAQVWGLPFYGDGPYGPTVATPAEGESDHLNLSFPYSAVLPDGGDASGWLSQTSIVWETTRDRAVLFGGEAPDGGRSAVTWATTVAQHDDGGFFARFEPVAVDAGPPARAGHALVFDFARGEVLLFGGAGADGGLLADTWAFRDDRWQPRATTGPSPRRYSAVAFFGGTDEVLLQGGQTATGTADDTWAWDGVRWRALDAGVLAAEQHQLASDAPRGRVLLAGGREGDGGPRAQPWEYTPARGWHPLPLSSAPMPEGTKWGWDWATPSVVAFGGDLPTSCSDCSGYDGVSASLLRCGPDAITAFTSAVPGVARTWASLGTGPGGALMVQGGLDINAGPVSTAFVLDGGDWAPVTTSGPGPVGGWTSLNHTLERPTGDVIAGQLVWPSPPNFFRLSGSVWSAQPGPAFDGGPVDNFALLGTAHGVRTVFTQRLTSLARGYDLEADGGWTFAFELPTFAGLVVHDFTRDRTVVIGSKPYPAGGLPPGEDLFRAWTVSADGGVREDPLLGSFYGWDTMVANEQDGTLWWNGGIRRLSVEPSGRPVVLAHLPLAPVMPAGTSVSHAEVRVRAAGHGRVGGQSVDGFRVVPWVEDGWRQALMPPTVGSADAFWSSDDPALLRRWALGRRRLSLGAVPLAQNADEPATVTVQWMEVIVRYRKAAP
jgi:hypothetical protein